MADPKKKKRAPGGPGATETVRRDAKDPMVHISGTDDDGNHFGFADRASALNIDPADVSPLNSRVRRAARAAAGAKFDRSLDNREKRRRMKQGASGVFGANRPGGAR